MLTTRNFVRTVTETRPEWCVSLLPLSSALLFRFVLTLPTSSCRLWEYGQLYFDPTNDRSFPDCEARRVFERMQKGQYRSSKRSGNDADKRDKKKRKERR